MDQSRLGELARRRAGGLAAVLRPRAELAPLGNGGPVV
jgi:hypothetical protein